MAMEERKWKDCQILPSSSFFDVVLLLGAFVLFLNRFVLLRDRLFSFVRFLFSFVLRFREVCSRTFWGEERSGAL